MEQAKMESAPEETWGINVYRREPYHVVMSRRGKTCFLCFPKPPMAAKPKAPSLPVLDPESLRYVPQKTDAQLLEEYFTMQPPSRENCNCGWGKSIIDHYLGNCNGMMHRKLRYMDELGMEKINAEHQRRRAAAQELSVLRTRGLAVVALVLSVVAIALPLFS
jgi:hypothetical protein